MDKKTTHSAIIAQALAEFDIETKVRKIAVEVFDKIVMNNLNTFSFVHETQAKILTLKQQMHSLELTSKNILVQVTTKLEPVQQLQNKFQYFDQKFWTNIKEVIAENGRHKRKIDDLSTQQQKDIITIETYGKQINTIKSKAHQLEARLDTSVLKMFQKMSEDFQHTNQEIKQRKHQFQRIIYQIQQSKALLDSKSEMISALAKDFTLYESERQIINSKLENVFKQVSERLMKSQFYTVRKYFDGMIATEKQINTEKYKQVNQKIDKLEKNKNQQINKIYQKIQQIQTTITNQQKTFNQKIHQLDQQTAHKLLTINKQINSNYQIYVKKMQQVDKGIQQIDFNIQKIGRNISKIQQQLQKHQFHIQQAESNIISINQILRNIEKQNTSRKEQLDLIKTQNENDLTLGQKLQGIINSIIQFKDFQSKLSYRITQNYQEYKIFHSQTTNKLTNLQNDANHQKNIFEERFKQLQLQTNNIKQSITSNNQIIFQKILNFKKQATSQVQAKIQLIKSQLNNLDELTNELHQFKQTFNKQVQENYKLNLEIKENVEKIFNMFTKIKSDFYLKVENISSQFNRKASIIREHDKQIQFSRTYLSQLTQIVNICLTSFVWKQFIDSEDHQEIKISSLIDGWVIQCQSKDKIKYRGQTILRHKLLQIALDYFVKVCDKIKGGFLESGKLIFNKILENNPDLAIRVRKRAISRGRRSQLPKVFK